MARSYDLPEKRPFITTSLILAAGTLLIVTACLSAVVWALFNFAFLQGG